MKINFNNETKTFNFITILSIIALLTSCSDDTIQGNKLNLDKLSKGFRIVKKDLEKTNKQIDSRYAFIPLTNSIPESRKDLINMRTVVKIYNGSENAGLTIPGFGGIKLGKDETNLNVYFLETKVVINASDSNVYGIGYSVHYLFKKVKKGLDISNLPSIAASVQIESNKTHVFYCLQTYGIYGINLIKYFKPTVNKNFDVEGFGIMQSSIDGIHNILGDSILSKSVKFTPEILKFVKPYELNQP